MAVFQGTKLKVLSRLNKSLNSSTEKVPTYTCLEAGTVGVGAEGSESELHKEPSVRAGARGAHGLQYPRVTCLWVSRAQTPPVTFLLAGTEATQEQETPLPVSDLLPGPGAPHPGLPVRSQYAGSGGYLPGRVSESQGMAPPGLARRTMVIQLLPPPRSLGPPAAPHSCFQKLPRSLLGRTAPQAAPIWGVRVSRGGVCIQLLAVQEALEGRTS